MPTQGRSFALFAAALVALPALAGCFTGGGGSLCGVAFEYHGARSARWYSNLSLSEEEVFATSTDPEVERGFNISGGSAGNSSKALHFRAKGETPVMGWVSVNLTEDGRVEAASLEAVHQASLSSHVPCAEEDPERARFMQVYEADAAVVRETVAPLVEALEDRTGAPTGSEESPWLSRRYTPFPHGD